MSNLFSIFDPNSFLELPLNWISLLTALIIIPIKFWGSPGPFRLVFNRINLRLHNEITLALGATWIAGGTLILTSLFSIIMINNFIGLIPYVFTASSHLVFTLRLALPVWASFFLSNLIFSTQRWLSHLVPLGTPKALIPFIVIIELVRGLIRPITLSVRLAANIVAGHLLLALLRGPLPQASWLTFLIIGLSLVVLRLLELAVAFIQAYVFSTLSSLYIAEVNSPEINSL